MAAPSVAWTGIVPEVLRKDNYENWSTLVQNYLVAQDLWHGIVEADPEKPDGEKDAGWRSKNAKALHAIQLACRSDTLSNIRTFKTAREAWNHLKAFFSEDVRGYPDIEQGRDQHIYPDIEQGPDRHIYRLHSDVKKGYWNDAKSYIISFPDAIFFTTSSTGRTALHVAVASAQVGIVKELVNMGNQRLLKMQDKRGYTALALASELTDNKSMAKWMIEKGGKDLLTIKTKQDDGGAGGEIPVLLASAKGHKQMTAYLYSETSPSVFFVNGGLYGIKLLTRCIAAEIFGVAASLIQHSLSRDLPLTHGSKLDRLRPIYALAHMPSAFLSGTQLGWWQRFIYNNVLRLQAYEDPYGKRIKIVSHVVPYEGQYTKTLAHHFVVHPLRKISRLAFNSDLIEYLCRLFGQCQELVQTSILLKLPGFQKIYERKVNHYLVLEILRFLRKRVSRLEESNLHECSVYDAMLQAAKYGIIEFINSMRLANPDLLWAMDKNKRGIFSHAILNRQEKVFQLIHDIEGWKEMIASREDVFRNNLLHLAAELRPSSDLSSRLNAALQMQRELHWFKAVDRIVPPKCKEARNADGKKPRELFTKNHEELVKAGEKWARDIAGSFTLVGTLIITIMFAADFTVPGGNDQNNGMPILVRKHDFTVFILSDAISLVTSTSSVLSFIWILTSRYAEKDFLWRLPLKLLFGLITLFISVATMMLAYVFALSMMLKGHRRVVIAAMSLAVIPVLVLIPTQLRLSFEIFNSTWRPYLLSSKKKKSKD